MSAAFSLAASRLDGAAAVFSNITELRLYSSLDSPADSLSAAVAADAFPGPIGDIKLYHNGSLLFSGQLDAQKQSVSRLGKALSLEARSMGALLLDNEAMPCTMVNAQITTIFNRYIAPYGFTLYNPNKSAVIPIYTVRAGMSEWDALVAFSRRAYGVTPYVKASQVMLARPYSEAPLTISNSGGIPYSALTHTRKPYNVLSKVVLRDENGNYSIAVKNSAADYIGAQRKRYAVPSTEYAGKLVLDGNQRIKRSMLGYEQVKITLPGVIDTALGRDVTVKDNGLALQNLMVFARELLINENGIVTELTLLNPFYYD